MNGFEHYKRWKWGTPHDKVVEVDLPLNTPNNPKDPRYVEIGRLVGFYLRPDIDLSKNKKQKHTQELMLTSPKDIEESYLVFDRKHPNHRLYISIPPYLRMATKKIYQSLPKSNPSVSLNEVGKYLQTPQTKGRHDNLSDYPNRIIKPIGYVTDIIYKTRKSGDGLSEYIHAFGEPYGKLKRWTSRPILAVDKDGYLWLWGGNYRAPYAGITN